LGTDVTDTVEHRDAAGVARLASGPSGGGGGRSRRAAPIRLAVMPLVCLTLAAFGMAYAPSRAGAGEPANYIDLGPGSRAASVRINAGKSENIHTDASFSEVVVSDPEVADVVPLTDHSLSILAKKIGSTRVSVYAEAKKLVGVFDVEVTFDTSYLGNELARRFPAARFRISSVNGKVLLSGDAPDAVTVDRAVQIAKQFGPDIINSVQVMQPQQVLLEVRFIEVSRTASRELGIQWKAVSNSLTATVGTDSLLSGTTPFGSFVANVLKGGINVDVLIKALEERDMARRLAEPNLVALSGDTASFLAGGEFPFPVAAQFGTVTVEWKRFGVGLAFTPTVLGNGLINLKIEPEVSQLDTTNTIQVANTVLPSLIVRRANTTIELRDGQSFAIAGLLQNVGNTQQQLLPWIGDVPVLGALFRSAQYQKKETDLAIIVTPHLVRPTRPGDTVRTPTDNTLPANDADFFLLGQAELTRPQKRQYEGTELPPSGHIIDLPRRTYHAAQR
jgi:pilus assembly protein CpaC